MEIETIMKMPEKRFFFTLDCMRGVAAFLVVIYHYSSGTTRLAQFGYLAVDFFFMLSGFVLAASYEARLKDRLSFFDFSKRRIIRLYPLYLLGLLLGVGVTFLKLATGNEGIGGSLFANFAANIFFLPSPDQNILYAFNTAHWTLLLELLVSFLFAAVLFRMESWQLFVLALASFALLYVTSSDRLLEVGWGWSNAYGGVLRVLYAFPIGMILFRLFGSIPHRQSLLAIVPCLLVVSALSIPELSLHPAIYAASVIGVGFPLLLVLAVHLEPPEYLTQTFKWLGEISYPVYALHMPIVILYLAVVTRMELPQTVAITVFLTIVAVISTVASRLIDVPVRVWLTEKLYRYRKA